MADPLPPGTAGKVVIFCTAGPNTPERCATPFFMASAGAALEHEVEMVFQIEGVRLMQQGVAEGLLAIERGKPVSEFIREAKALGVAMRCCSGSLHARGISPEQLIPECDGLVGGATMIELGLSAHLVLCY